MKKDKLISANSVLRKLNDRLDNYEDLPPMTVGDFIRMINEEPGVTMKHRTTPFNRNFARLLDEKDITLKQIAEMTGIARDAIYRYRNGGNPPTVPRADTLLRLARVLGVTMDELYGGEEN